DAGVGVDRDERSTPEIDGVETAAVGAQLEVADARSEDVVHHGGVVVGSTTGCLVRVGGGGIDDSEEPWPPAAAQLEDRGRVAGRVELADELRVPLDERAGEDAAVRRTREAVH